MGYQTNCSFAEQSSQSIGHHRRHVFHIKQICHMLAEIGIAEPIETAQELNLRPTIPP